MLYEIYPGQPTVFLDIIEMAGEHVPQRTEVVRGKAADSVDKSLDTGNRFDHANGGYKKIKTNLPNSLTAT